jgi:GNAT superfamily N-acetyltransferase
MALELRAFRPADYPALAALQRACEPEHPLSEAHWRHEDGLDDPRTRRARVVAMAGGELIGYAGFMQCSLMFHPRRFVLYGGVAPTARGQGVGRALYAWLQDALAPFAPERLGAGLWSQQADGEAWLARRGYGETLREIESALAFSDFEPAAWTEAQARGEAAGVRLVSLAALGEGEVWRRRLFDLDMAFSTDIPMTGALTPPEYGIYAHLYFACPGYRPELCWLALAPGPAGEPEPVGLCWHALAPAPGELETIVSGVRRDWRGRGVALALKSRALADAKERGYARVCTRNAATNAGMLAVNTRLGYRPIAARLVMEKELSA